MKVKFDISNPHNMEKECPELQQKLLALGATVHTDDSGFTTTEFKNIVYELKTIEDLQDLISVSNLVIYHDKKDRLTVEFYNDYRE